jgi:hypothetical protein
VAFLACFAACVALRWKARSAPYVLTAFGYSVAFVVAVVAFTNVERIERYECNWKMGAEGVEVDLSPADGFSWSRVDSDQLADHLLKDRPPKVSVDVEIIRDFGNVRARGLILRVDGFPVREPEP